MKRALAAMTLLLGTASASAQTADPSYPIVSLLDSTQNTVATFQDPTIGFYNFQAGLFGIATRAADRYPSIFSQPQTTAQVRNEISATVDAAVHLRPNLPYDPAGGDVGDPRFMPDWNRNGVYGEAADFDADTDSDPHAVPAIGSGAAFFRYPCPNADGSVDYVDASGLCAKNPTSFRVGVAREIKVVNARGLVIDATLWLPGHVGDAPLAFPCGNCTPEASFEQILVSAPKLPGVVFSNGFLSRQEHYYWFAERMAREGFVVLTYDPAGQGESEGNAVDLFDFANQSPDALGAAGGACQFAGSCRDIEDMVRWFVGEPVKSLIATLNDKDLRIVPRRDPETENSPNPALAIVDVAKVGLAGHSMGAISTLHYLLGLGNGAGMDGRPLPPLAAAISLSGAGATHAVVPLQFQTSDYDGSPAFVVPTVLGVNLGGGSDGIGYNLIKQKYNELRDDEARTAPIELVILEGGVHVDQSAVPVIPRTNWSIQLSSDYSADWMRCHLAGSADACATALEAREHISRAFASEHAPAGSTESQCIRVPDRAILNQPPADFLAAYAEDKHVCDCVGTTEGRTCDTPQTFVP